MTPNTVIPRAMCSRYLFHPTGGSWSRHGTSDAGVDMSNTASDATGLDEDFGASDASGDVASEDAEREDAGPDDGLVEEPGFAIAEGTQRDLLSQWPDARIQRAHPTWLRRPNLYHCPRFPRGRRNGTMTQGTLGFDEYTDADRPLPSIQTAWRITGPMVAVRPTHRSPG